MRHTYLVCYDIADDKRRDRVFRTCRNHGTHLQFSVFECDLSARELASLERELGGLIRREDDQVLFVLLGPSESRGDRVIRSLGRAYTKFDAPCYVV